MAEWTKVNGAWELVEGQAVAVADPPAEAPAQRLPTDGRRQCGTCGVVKSLELFRVSAGSVEGRSRHCCTCLTRKEKIIRDRVKADRLAVPPHAGSDVTARELIAMLSAACTRWQGADDNEDQTGAADAVIYRARQLLAAVEAKA